MAFTALTFRGDLIQSLVEQKHEVWVFCLDYTDKTKDSMRRLGATPVDYKFSRGGVNPISDLWCTWKLSKHFKKIQADLVFSYFSKPVIFGTFAAVLAGIKRRVGMLEGLGYVFTDLPGGLDTKRKLLRHIQVFLYRLSFPLLERIIFLNPDDPKDLLDKYAIKVKQVDVLGGIGLTLSDYPYSKPTFNPIRFIFIGRLLAEKGIHEYIEAARIVKNTYPTTEFIVLGGIDEENPGGLTKQQLDSFVAECVIIYPGHVDNVAQWLANSSVFVLPSYREGVPRSTQEAMAIGRAIITTDVPGCRETVDNGINGFIVPPWQPEALAKAMCEFIARPDLIESMGLESYRIAQEKFDAEEVNQRLIALLRV